MMIDLELEIVRKNGGDIAVYLDIRRLDSLPYQTRQHILSKIGDAVLQDLVDGTEVTADLIKQHLKRACTFFINAARIPA
jgi:hypothetical protein